LFKKPNIFIEIFKPIQTSRIISLIITCNFDRLIAWKFTLSILISKIVDSLNYKKRRNILAFAINIYNRYSLFSIARLNNFAFITSISFSYNYKYIDYTYYKANLVEVLEIVILNLVFSPYISYKSKLRFNSLRVFVQSSLKIVRAIKAHFQL